MCVASRLTLDDGTSIFAKTWPSGPAPVGFFEAEAAGLRWLRSAGAAPVPEVLVALPSMLAMEWIEPGSPSRSGAADLGRALADLHRFGAPSFGGSSAAAAFIGSLPLDNTPSSGPWSEWFAGRRLEPYLRRSADRGALSGDDVRAVEQIMNNIARYEFREAPALTHGDLWPGNVLWALDGRAWLVDPAAHGGHRETDLAALALFGGAPHLQVILDAYDEAFPLAEGWRERVPLHQLHLLLVHTAAFGAAYAGAVRAAADAVLRL